MDATEQMETARGLRPGQKVIRSWLSDSWSNDNGFYVWTDIGSVSAVEEEGLGMLVRHGSLLSAAEPDSRTAGRFGRWTASKAAAVEAVVDELRRRIEILRQQCDRLVTDLRNNPEIG